MACAECAAQAILITHDICPNISISLPEWDNNVNSRCKKHNKAEYSLP